MICKKCNNQIEEDSKFCPYCGERTLLSTDKTKIKNAKERGKSKYKIFAIILVAVLLLSVIYVGSYYRAVNYANNMEYEKAVKFVPLTELTSKHDSGFVNYLNACKTLLSGDTFEAEKKFTELGNYLCAEEMICECMYVRAIQYYEEGAFIASTESFIKLLSKNPNYRDTADKIAETVRIIVDEEIRSGKYDIATNTLVKYIRYSNQLPRLVEMFEELKPELYEAAVRYFEKDEYRKATSIFQNLDGYELSDTYKSIISLVSDVSLNDFGDGGAYLTAVKNIRTLNAGKILMINDVTAKSFLRGKWITDDGRYYFELSQDDTGNYANRVEWNLSTETIKGYFVIDDGYLISDNDLIDLYAGEGKRICSFSLIDENTIVIHVIRDNVCYTLYRQ